MERWPGTQNRRELGRGGSVQGETLFQVLDLWRRPDLSQFPPGSQDRPKGPEGAGQAAQVCTLQPPTTLRLLEKAMTRLWLSTVFRLCYPWTSLFPYR